MDTQTQQTYRPGVDVIVVAYRQPDHLRRFVNTLRRWPPTVDMTLHVVDVDPAEPSGLSMADLVDGDGLAVEFPNIGFNRAANRAGARGDREVVALFNADVAFIGPSGQHQHRHVIDAMHEALAVHANWGIVGPRQRDSQDRITAGGIFGTYAKPRHRAWMADANSHVARDVRDDAVTVAGSAFALRRDTWDQLTACPVHTKHAEGEEGPFLPNHHYWGETWVCYHAAAHNLRSVYLGDVECIHDIHGADPTCRFGRQHAPADQARFRAACDDHGLAHD